VGAARLPSSARTGDETALVAALAHAGVPVVVAHPRPVLDVATATGPLATTDRLDAHLLALFADRVRPEPRPDAAQRQLDALVTRRRPRLERGPAETTRLAHAQPPVRHDLTRHVRGLERRVADVTRDLDRTIQSRPLWRATATLDRTTPGVGPVRSRPGLADRHELGTLTRTPIAALVGV
jgi:transposase